MTLSEMFIFDGNSHPSILKIKNNTQHNTLFDFKPTDVDTVNKLVSKINIKKATGVMVFFLKKYSDSQCC